MIEANGIAKLDRERAEWLLRRFLPLFEQFEARKIDYCLVGGLAVLAHCLDRDSNRLRATVDADILVPDGYSNAEFAQDYLRVYAANPAIAPLVYKAVFGEEGFEELSLEENAFANLAFIGADEALDGVDTPDFDVCRKLNGRTLSTVKRQRIVVCGMPIWVATVDELLGMKKDTMALYGEAGLRPQDYLDMRTLESLEDKRD